MIRLLILLSTVMTMTGCLFNTRDVVSPDVPTPPVWTITGLADWAVWIGALAIIISIPLAIWGNIKTAGMVSLTGLGIVIGGVVLGWIAAHIGIILIISAIVGVVAAYLYFLKNKKKVDAALEGIGIDIIKDEEDAG